MGGLNDKTIQSPDHKHKCIIIVEGKEVKVIILQMSIHYNTIPSYIFVNKELDF